MDLLPFDKYVRSLDRKRMSAGVLFHDTAGRVLPVEPSYKPHWDIPGGVVDAGEAPWVTAFIFYGGVISDQEVADLVLTHLRGWPPLIPTCRWVLASSRALFDCRRL